MSNDKRTILCPCCGGIGGVDNHDCPLCQDRGVISEQERREWVAVRTLIRFDDLPIDIGVREIVAASVDIKRSGKLRRGKS